jgi:Ca2+-binding RTX toxin-like protein
VTNFIISSYNATGQSLSLAQLLDWSGNTITSQSSTQIKMQVRDLNGALGLPGDYDLILVGNFTLLGGLVTGGTVTSVIGRVANSTTTLSSVGSFALNLSDYISLGSTSLVFTNPTVATVLAGNDGLRGGTGADTLSGLTLNDTIRGEGGNDIITGGAGADSLYGGANDDVFRFVGTSLGVVGDNAAGEIIDGGSEFDKIELFSGAYNFATSKMTGIECLDFVANNALMTVALNGTQIGGNAIRFVDGSSPRNTLTIEGSSVDLTGVTFANWQSNDAININGVSVVQNTLRGGLNAEIITGGNASDNIYGGGGTDTLIGGASSDTFHITNALQAVAGLQIDGGTGIADILAIDMGDGQVADFRSTSLLGLETLAFISASSDYAGAIFNADQFSQFTEIRSVPRFVNDQSKAIFIFGLTNQDLSNISFARWISRASPVGGFSNSISLWGTSAADSFTGTEVDDFIYSGDGRDNLNSGEGRDVFYIEGSDRADNIDGGVDKDTIDFSLWTNTSFRYNIDLSNGTYTLSSNSAGAEGIGTIVNVENVTGSSFGETIKGNAGFNVLRGLAGNDTLNGDGGNDTLFGGAGADSLDGGADSDEANYTESTAGITVSLLTGAGFGGHAEGDTLVGIERLEGSNFADTLTGDFGENILRGGEQDDNLNGSRGDDSLYGDEGDDILTGGSGSDYIVGGTNGSVGDTVSFVNSRAAVVVTIFEAGVAGNRIGSGVGTGTDEGNGDDFREIENIRGSNFDDILTGDNLANAINGLNGLDRLNGGAGHDSLAGGAGSDVLNGGANNDTLDGGTQADTFVYDTLTWGNDRIVGWDDGSDKIDLAVAGFDFSDFTKTQNGTDTLLTLSTNPSHSIRIEGVLATSIEVTDFI